MSRWKPDPTFYPSPRMAGQAPPEQHAYVALLEPDQTSRPDALGVLDLDPKSPTYGTIVSTLEMPQRRRRAAPLRLERVQRGALPVAPRPHVERRYLVVPGLRSSRMHIVDTKPDPRDAEDREDDRARRARARDRLLPPAHHPLRAGRDLHVGAGRRERRRRGRRHLPAGLRVVRPAGPLGGRPRPSAVRLRLLVAPRLRHVDVQRVGHARRCSSTASCPRSCSAASTATRCTSGTCARAGTCKQLDLGDAAPDGARAAARARPAQGLRVRRRGRLGRGPVGVGLAVAPRGRRLGDPQGDHDPGRAGRAPSCCRRCCRGSARCRRWSPTSTCRSTTASSTSPAGAPATSSSTTSATRSTRARSGRCGWAGSSRRASHPAVRAADRRAADGRVSPRRPPRLRLQLALLELGHAVLPGRPGRLDGQARRRPGRRPGGSIPSSS